MRCLLFTVLFGAACSAWAQQPPRLEPLPDVPPPPPGIRDIEPDEPRVRIPVGAGDKVEVIREAGQSRMKVTPENGPTYHLIEHADGTYRRAPLDDGVRVPQWTIFTFD
ncbi:MAG: DUF2782 domain-containing protein [Betaproteobacteria bacterium]|nr:DUF2782 domain-containing protein [Betaproteobacteria bacterium]